MELELILAYTGVNGDPIERRITPSDGNNVRLIEDATGTAYRLNPSGNVWNVGSEDQYKTPIHVGTKGQLLS